MYHSLFDQTRHGFYFFSRRYWDKFPSVVLLWYGTDFWLMTTRFTYIFTNTIIIFEDITIFVVIWHLEFILRLWCFKLIFKFLNIFMVTFILINIFPVVIKEKRKEKKRDQKEWKFLFLTRAMWCTLSVLISEWTIKIFLSLELCISLIRVCNSFQPAEHSQHLWSS